ncbi:competence protein CoiA-like protein [Asanoa ferruginea]|uniref:Competence protein CoiA-like protein n=1 Tax=Asanoa ferruginea TaxID=53367 RepID=A0A3D9ZJS9_9ACTN|nr:competence protein CoiA family protein [Asanoa ferruginea]REF97525.1 competence protein CoiA-like protein [Asanoa ferruginea]GIF48186.1 hypothetical protein Afe04nite_27250 [Asanoa ferruginea]
MLVALSPVGPVEAERDLADDEFSCPLCQHLVVLKRGRVKIAHFAHAPGADCIAVGESPRHLLAKKVLAEQFRGLGYHVELEQIHSDGERRVDVAVWSDKSRQWVAVEVQDSPISVEAMKARAQLDRRAGFLGTAWVWTGRRFDLLLPIQDGAEARIPPEMRWFNNRYKAGVFLLDAPNEEMWWVQFGSAGREGSSYDWYEQGGTLSGVDYPGRTLVATKRLFPERVSFRLEPIESPWHKPHKPDWGIVFTP